MQITEKCKYFRSSATKEDILNHEAVCSIPEVEQCPHYLAHCISADFGMGKGIVTEFNKRYDMKRKLQTLYPDYLNQWTHHKMIGDCIQQDYVFNLITKERYYMKPTYKSLNISLNCTKGLVNKGHINKIAMPMIGCGLDRLEWESVRNIIINVFEKTDVDIVICKL